MPGRTPSGGAGSRSALFVAGLVVLGDRGGPADRPTVTVSRNADLDPAGDRRVRARCARPTWRRTGSTAAQEAARKFIGSQDDGTRIGLVAFPASPGCWCRRPPTSDKLLDAIDKLRPPAAPRSAWRSSPSIDAIAEINPNVPPTGVELGTGGDADATPPGGLRRRRRRPRRLRAGHHRRAHRRREHPGRRPAASPPRRPRPATCGSTRSGSARPARAAGVHHRPDRRRRARRRAVRQRPPPGGGGGGRRFLEIDEATLQGWPT